MKKFSSPSDEQLVESIKSSQIEAFTTLYYRYYNNLYRLFWLRTNSKEKAKDLIQDVFTRIWENRQKLDSKKSIKAYLYRIANNLVIDSFRKKSSQEIYFADRFSANDISTEKSLETDTAVKLAINNLPEKIRIVFILSRYHGFKYAEIAQTLKISIKTVASRMGQAFHLLREELS